MLFEVIVRLVIVLRYGNLFDGSVHAFDLTVNPTMIRQGKPVFNVMFFADIVKCVAFDRLGCLVTN